MSKRRQLLFEQFETRALLSTFVVDRTDDTNAAAAQVCSGMANDCSLRGAISKANGAAGNDVITFDAATNGTPFTLTLLNAGGTNEDANATGDLDVLATGGLTITGNGSANTIIQGGTTNLNGIDKVFAFNPLCDAAAAFSISDVTIRFGRNTQPNGAADFSFTGGGLDFCGTGNVGSSFSISNSIVTQNTNTDGYGGGMNIDEVFPATSAITITNTQFTNNTSKYWGGGLNIFGDNGSATISGSTFSNNQTLGTGGAGAQGGGINLRITNQDDGDGAPTPFVNIDNTTIANNIGVGFGGGIDVQGGGNQDVNITNTSITGNSLIVVAGGVTNTTGGGLEHNNNAARTTTLTNVLIANNTSIGSIISDGGGLAHGAGVLIVRNSTISGNSATRDGGGVHMTTDPTLTLINTTISNNRADSDNTGTGTGGGINKLAGAGVLTMQNTISDGNFKGIGAVVNEIAGTVTANFSLIGNTAGATFVGSANNQLNVSGRLAALASNGGQTVGPTGFTSVLQTHATLAGSPAHDNGSNALVPGPLTTDQRGTGFTRILDAADANTTDTVDIGAYEAHPTVEDVSNQTINQLGSLSTSFNVGDANFTSGIDTITVTSSNTTLVPNANINVGGSGTNSIANSTNGNQTLVITPAANQVGTTTITLTVTDLVNGTTQTMTDTFVFTVTAADLTVGKTDTVSNATTLGNTWDWRSTITNGGNGSASFANTQVIYTDTMPNTNISYGSPSIGSSTGITGTINCALTGGNVITCSASGAVSIAPAGSFRVDVTATPTAAGTFTNPTGGSATADPNSHVSESNEGNNDSNNDSVVVTAPDLTVSKTDTVGNATAFGNTWDWRSTISNGGNAPANYANTQVIYTDTMPSTNVTYGSPSIGTSTGITGTINCSLSGGNVILCTASGAVSIASSGSFRVDVTATPSATGTFTNPTGGSASADPNNNVLESNEGNNDSNSDSVLVTAPDLTVSKTDTVGGATTLGNTWDWQSTISNGGNAPANFANGQTIFTDTMPSTDISYGAPLIGTSSGITGVIACVRAANVVTCSANDPVSIAAAGSFRLDVTATPLAIGTFTNPTGGSAAADPNNNVVEGNEGNNDSNSDSVSVTVTATADLAIVKTESADPVLAGTSFSYAVNVTNNGPSDASGVTVSDTLATGLTFNAAGSSAGCSAVAQVVTCLIGALVNGASSAKTIGADVASSVVHGAVISNTATVAGSEADPAAANDSSTIDTTVNRQADVSVTKTPSSTTVLAGAVFDYVVQIANSGPSDAGGVSVSDTLPIGLTFNAANSSAACSAVGQVVKCVIGRVFAGTSSFPQIGVKVASSVFDGTMLSNTASVTINEFDLTPADHSSTVAVTVNRQVDVSVTKTPSSTTVIAGAVFDYVVQIANSGPSDARVSVTDTLPTGLTFNAANSSPACSAVGQVVTCAIGRVFVGTSSFPQIGVKVASSVFDGTILSNTASVAIDEFDLTPADHSSTVVVTVNRQVDVSVTKTPSSTTVLAGAVFNYVVQIANSGPSDAGGVLVSDTLPIGLTFNAANSSPACSAVGQVVTCVIGRVFAGTSSFPQIGVKVASSVANGTMLSNTASVTNNETDPTPADHSSTAVVTVNRQANLSIVKTDSADPVLSGTSFSYTVNVTNNGPSDASGVAVSDTLAAELTFNAAGSSVGCSAVGQVVTCLMGALVNGASSAKTIGVNVASLLVHGTVISNTATVAGSEADPVSANNSSTQTTTVNRSF